MTKTHSTTTPLKTARKLLARAADINAAMPQANHLHINVIPAKAGIHKLQQLLGLSQVTKTHSTTAPLKTARKLLARAVDIKAAMPQVNDLHINVIPAKAGIHKLLQQLLGLSQE